MYTKKYDQIVKLIEKPNIFYMCTYIAIVNKILNQTLIYWNWNKVSMCG